VENNWWGHAFYAGQGTAVAEAAATSAKKVLGNGGSEEEATDAAESAAGMGQKSREQWSDGVWHGLNANGGWQTSAEKEQDTEMEQAEVIADAVSMDFGVGEDTKIAEAAEGAALSVLEKRGTNEDAAAAAEAAAEIEEDTELESAVAIADRVAVELGVEKDSKASLKGEDAAKTKLEEGGSMEEAEQAAEDAAENELDKEEGELAKREAVRAFAVAKGR
jgi:hypothetical protein